VAASVLAEPLTRKDTGILVAVGALTPFAGIAQFVSNSILSPEVSKILKPMLEVLAGNRSKSEFQLNSRTRAKKKKGNQRGKKI
jgi:hypothetical protein